MMNWINMILSAAAGYLIGSFSFSITLSRILFSQDVREKGSGNAGATNMARAYGVLPGVLTLVGDFMKAALAVTLGSLLAGEWGMTAAGIACLTGHCFPVYYGFTGGKGVTVALAMAFAADWRCGVIALAGFAIVVLIGRKVSLASLSATAVTMLFSLFLGLPMRSYILLAYAVFIIFFRHTANIKRLLRHEEPDFKAGKR